ncbi:hypothetical protein PAP_06840 [Palaeococcus pacificus DY20341]|uniref:CobQ/CobB/MinD/ParA nucleotide binding domain-containing protein n=1 Tax=Palaeococcus pacificus DY20341 TaxID=1343739 RepID=A0A075LYW7_9EURY|nr:P-loop NTPase [Palaeococcus pacificus]AIF69763.1 hypothetical protein PAP_06840 [Palaeococcus pacificus DY20341]
MALVLVTGPGGTGKSVLTLNLAAYLAKRYYNVLMVDGDLFLPDLADYMNLGNVKYTLHKLLTDSSLEAKAAVYKNKKQKSAFCRGIKN